ncbi:MAG: hypothetical protein QGG71_11825 [Pirellulaceae bacterium]|jgi:hypothetical protein|nr:hypothetical protein [Pirellulaceae bacterium]
MELQHVNVKIFVDGDLPVDPEQFINVFHTWTAEQSCDELLIDVADYRHVPAGPGVVLVGHEADYAMDKAGQRWGLLYNRKASTVGSNEDRFTQAFRAAASACRRLEDELTGLQFSRQEFQLFINDRALAPNVPETLDACRVEIESFLQSLLGHGNATLTTEPEPRRRFGVLVQTDALLDLAQIAGAKA